ncbi:ABC-F family ATP-binding cassette domain-containing protein [Lysobacter enzymogenes]|uniref:ABC-F family ATP-binding cassette domain-containing protein n=1 Tax=Lysobacter enzymogenes TaxID=69 RepID=UPI001A96A228|nr:ABC-F family ATP-binding cassette domain-containing protein [Lysobacter enzymogenes]QQP95402.1 ABC-F family ATP-binding cassette domain-containing protein [Lysobacter enzymogenes]
MAEAYVRVSHLHFSWPDGSPVFADLSLRLGPLRTGVVAPNGAGKSTLLRLLAGHLQPSAGRIEVGGRLAYLPQQAALPGEATVADALGVAARLRALAAIENGSTDPALFDAVGEDWDLAERSRAALARCGLDDVPLQARLERFSGGEQAALNLAARLLQQPDVLLLDEPSNHLDRAARQRLYALIDEWRGCLLVASHDRALLERMDQIGELAPAALRVYGGGYGFYRDAAAREREAAEDQLRQLRQHDRRERLERQQARERNERRTGNARRNAPDAGLPRIVAGNLRRAAQVSAAKSEAVHAARADAARTRMSEAAQALREAPALDLDLPATRVPAGRTVLRAQGLRYACDGRELFAAPGLDLDIRGPERIALGGANGAGKSTLLRLLSGELSPQAGELRRGEGRIAVLSQGLDALDPALSVADHLHRAAPDLPANERANLLARWLFRGERMQLPVAALSGGERLRATLACLLHAQPAPQLLLLDEPSNHLDLDATAELERALRGYQGALVVVSHDPAFVEALAPTRRLELADGRLREAG